MAKEKKRSFFERLTGGVRLHDEDEAEKATRINPKSEDGEDLWNKDEETDGELALDVYQTPSDIMVHTFVAGVRPEDLEINITRDMLTIRGKRQESRTVSENDYFSRELYWGSFSRTVSLPQEVEPEEAEAIERHGLLTIRLPKIDKNKKSNLKVKSV
ncbi:MAG: Hsp20/alpha crystallin family protein [Candidatus Pacebacteria bacterium]|nr:Hsp20/alpha crystallin family protein [Candidatus Paceibacterota bacterium]